MPAVTSGFPASLFDGCRPTDLSRVYLLKRYSCALGPVSRNHSLRTYNRQMKWLRRAFACLTSDLIPRVLGKVRIGNFRYRASQPLGTPRPAATDFSLAVPFRYEAPSKGSSPLGVVCHLFHADLAKWMFQALNQIPQPTDIYISTDTQEKADIIDAVFSEWSKGAVSIRVVENRGRDIAPKLVTFADIYNRYDLMLFLHSKKSPHYGFGEAWRDYLVQSLAGSPAIVNSIVEIFDVCPSVGMVIPQHYSALKAATGIDWGANFGRARRLAWRMDIDISEKGYLDMPSGSMFWARPKALQPLLGLGLSMRDFPPEPCHWDGTIAHSIERLFLFSCEKAGFGWLKVAPGTHASETIVGIEKPSDIETFVSRHRFDLLGVDGNHR